MQAAKKNNNEGPTLALEVKADGEQSFLSRWTVQKHNHPYSSTCGQKAFTSMLNFLLCLSIQQAAAACYIHAHCVATATHAANTNAIIIRHYLPTQKVPLFELVRFSNVVDRY